MTAATKEPGNGRGCILVVDDDDDIRSVMSQILEEEGYRVITAADGAEAIELLHKGERPRVILLDLMMPKMSGWAFRERMQQDASLAGVPVLIMTGDGRISDKATSLSAAGYLRKPIDLAGLLGMVARFGEPGSPRRGAEGGQR